LQGEYDGAGLYNSGSPTEYFYGCYVRNSDLRLFARAFQANRDALTCTFGTAVSTATVSDSAQNGCVYLGNANAAFVTRSGGGYGAVRYSRSGTTLTLQGSSGGDMGQRIDGNFTAFTNNGSTQYRYAWAGTGNGDSQVAYGASTFGSTNYDGTPTYIAYPARRAFGTNLNAADKLGMLYYTGSGFAVRALGITWNSAAVPTISLGTVSSDITDVYATPQICPGHQANEMFMVYNTTATNLGYRLITASGTTLTVGSFVQIVTGLSNTNYRVEANSAVVGTKTYIVAVCNQYNTSGASVVAYRLT
jgi:hypothetical protein